jgi:hypothetical protein
MSRNNKQAHIIDANILENVERALHCYFEGLYHADSQLLAKAFHPDARYVNAMSGNYSNLSMSEYFKVIDQRHSPAKNHDDYHCKIISIELDDTQMAFAKVSIIMMERQYIDFLTLTTTDGQWKIMSKVFSYQAIKNNPLH